MTTERTNLESGLIPVSAYVVVACCEAYYRYPDMVRAIEAAADPGSLGAAGRRPGTQVNPVYLWSIANFYLTGRKVLVGFGVVPDSVPDTYTVLDFWERAALGYRADGHRQAADADFVVQTYEPGVISTLVDTAVEVVEGAARNANGPIGRDRVKRFSATMMSYLFLMYFDTRVGTGDTGPYDLGGGRVLLVRDFYRLSRSDFWWSDVAGSVPYSHLTLGLILENVSVKVNDWGTSVTDPEDYLDRLVGFSLFTTDNPEHRLVPVGLDEMDYIIDEVRKAQSQHYRNIAAMSRAEKIRCGAYVYFSFLRPFAELAGVAGDLDWTVPRDTLGPVYDMVEPLEGGNLSPDPDQVYYTELS
ncbi:MAG: hypothetical protein ACYCS7_11375 [Acidimicrobiales bacterium]